MLEQQKKPAVGKTSGSETGGSAAATPGKQTQVKAQAASAGGAAGIDMAMLQSFISKHEGSVDHVYLDSRGFKTAGIGHLLAGSSYQVGQKVSAEQITTWFKQDVAKAIARAKQAMGGAFDKLNPARQIVVIDMVFNLGEAGFAGCHETIAAMKAGNFAAAADDMMHSQLASQVGSRAAQSSSIMRSGELSGAASPPDVVRNLPGHFVGFNQPNAKHKINDNNAAYDNEVKKVAQGGTLRWPGGTVSDVLDENHNTVITDKKFQNLEGSKAAIKVTANNGDSLAQFAKEVKRTNAKAIIDVNAFTADAAAAGQLASTVKTMGIPVSVWELGNEPYLFENFFNNGEGEGKVDSEHSKADAKQESHDAVKNYLNKMHKFAIAIGASFPHPNFAIAMTNELDSLWNQAVLAYKPKFWNSVTIHNYGVGKPKDGQSQAAAQAAAIRADNKNLNHLSQHIDKLSRELGSNIHIDFTEFNAGLVSSPIVGTLYNAIYVAEFVARTSGLAQVSNVDLQSLYGGGTEPSGDPSGAIRATVTDPQHPTQGQLVLSPQGKAMEIVNGAILGADRVVKTSIQVPDGYAQAYARADGSLSVLFTNKGSGSPTVDLGKLDLDGVAVNSANVKGAKITSLSGPNPTAKSAQIKTSHAEATHIELAPYSVSRVDLPKGTVAPSPHAPATDQAPKQA